MKHVLSISGGKDSTAMYLYALERGIEFLPIFADTGNEHEITYDYVKTLHEKTGGPEVKIVKADFSSRILKRRMFISRDQRKKKLRYSNKMKKRILENLYPSGNPFLDLCMLKGRFPSTRARFCSQELKGLTIYSEVFESLADNNIILSWQGVRADESRERANYRVSEIDKKNNNIINYRPLLKWDVQRVFQIHKKHEIRPNPLYQKGFSRVGCFPNTRSFVGCKKS
ncbi:MAG: phosphoadenosine phosphosulfate reductase family protein [Desulfobacterales bacterium]|nr:phosphoadenosine phosphosulfate reductase family protein [Desulfobacterales bacterium]